MSSAYSYESSCAGAHNIAREVIGAFVFNHANFTLGPTKHTDCVLSPASAHASCVPMRANDGAFFDDVAYFLIPEA